ncbi:NUDIX domain-containing protein [Luedemannella helvata]|uniref:Nudix hydrolase domain-containing protein n=1 Tax=Luedemannella helvata TaxID=349315 RepID=A0ABP4XCV0_9ACTN
MIERVRAVLVTPNNELLLIRRQRSDQPVYWVLPGGHVEPTDRTREAALQREVHEELAGTPRIHSLIQVIDGTDDRQYIYLARIAEWSFADRNGPEFTEPGRGAYNIDTIPPTAEDLAEINLKPDQLATFLINHLHGDIDLFTLPDLRDSRRPD